MSWNVTPAAAAVLGAQGLNERRFVDQFWYAIGERIQATGGLAPFPQAHEYDSFTIEAVSDGGSTFTITDSAKAWATSPHHRWTDPVPGSDGVPEWAATSYDVIVDADRSGAGLSEPDQRAVLQAPIASHTATTLTCTFDLAALVRERGIPGVASLVGRRGWIVRRGGDNYTRGFIRWPNAQYFADAVVESAAWAGTPGDSDLLVRVVSDARLGGDDAQAGRDAVYLDTLGKMRRAEVIGHAGTSIVLSPEFGVTELPVAGGAIYFLDAGGYWQWGRTGGPVQAAHAGLTTNYVAHSTSADEPTVVGMPRLTYPVFYGQDSLSCPVDPEEVVLRNDPDGLDVDYRVLYDNVCAAGDVYLAPNWWQCWRALWVGAFRLAPLFVKPIGYDGAAAIPNFTYATWLYYAGVGGHSVAAGTHSGSTLPCALGVPHTPINLWWTVVGADGSALLSGYHEDYNGTNLSGAFSAAHDGKTVIASVGPDRFVERAFAQMSDVRYFLPGLDGGGSPVVPPTETYPGTWVTLAASTHYLMSDHDGYVGESSLARHAIADGHYARYAGHRLHDPGFPVRLPADDDTLALYHDYAYVGKRRPAVESRIDGSLSGTVTKDHLDGTVLTDASKDWRAVDFYPALNGYVHAGTFTSGSGFGGTDATKAGTNLWAAGRYTGFAGTLVGFTVEVLMSGSSFTDPDAVVEKRLITSGNGATGALAWDWSLSASASGKAYRIREPWVLNRWAGFRVFFANTDGDSATVAVLGNDDDTLFTAESTFPYTVGTTYAIDPGPRIGDVCKRVSGAWVTTSGLGADARYGGSTFRQDASRNLGDVMHEYGLPQPTDCTFAVGRGPQQLYDAINVLHKTKVTGGWDNPADNLRGPASFRLTASGETYANWADWVINGHAVGGDASNTDYFLHNGPDDGTGAPFAKWDTWGLWQWLPTGGGGNSWQQISGFTGEVERQFNRYRVTPPQTAWSKTIDFYDFAEKWATTASTVTGSTHHAEVSTFDDEGDLVAENVYTLWSTKTVTTADAVSDDLGALDPPNDAGSPTSGDLPAGTSVGQTGGDTHTSGYRVTDVIVTADYAFKFV